MESTQLPTSFKELMPIPPEYYGQNRERIINGLKKRLGDNFKPGSFILMRGHEFNNIRPDDDASSDPQCEPNFLYLFGLPFYYHLHAYINLDSGEVGLVVRNLSEHELVFEGGLTNHHSAKEFHASRIITEAELEGELLSKCKGDLFILRGKIRNEFTKEAKFPWMNQLNVNHMDLYAVLCEERAVKSQIEIDIMREVISVTCRGHLYMLKNVKPGIGEHHLSELFKFHCGLEGSSKEAYGCIVGSGRNGSILHYIVNNKECKDGEIVLADVGVMGNGYCADVTSTFPVNGKFDPKQKQIYEACLKSNRESMAMVKPGVNFIDIHKYSVKVILEELVKMEILKGDVEEMMTNRIGTLFMPHGLGHYLGLYTHDVGCCIHSDKDNCTVSTSVMATALKAGMVITIEPGIYFIRSIMEDYKADPEKAKFINFDKWEEYFYVGGVRIEDNVLVTETGFDNMSPLPRTVEEIESYMASGN